MSYYLDFDFTDEINLFFRDPGPSRAVSIMGSPGAPPSDRYIN